jgi:hypothetical protein
MLLILYLYLYLIILYYMCKNLIHIVIGDQIQKYIAHCFFRMMAKSSNGLYLSIVGSVCQLLKLLV